MALITRESELLANIETLKRQLNGSSVDRDFGLDLVRLGICFVVTEEDGSPFFAPSRFVGYRNNTRHNHLHNPDKDGRDTNTALEGLLRTAPKPSEPVEREYETFCVTLGLQVRKAPFAITRKFWDLRQSAGN